MGVLVTWRNIGGSHSETGPLEIGKAIGQRNRGGRRDTAVLVPRLASSCRGVVSVLPDRDGRSVRDSARILWYGLAGENVFTVCRG